MSIPTEPCFSCKGHCCKVGFVVRVFPNESIYRDDRYIHKAVDPGSGEPFHNMKSNGDGYTCIALGENNECTIWNQRPQMCRDFEASGERCKSLRKHFGRP